MTYGINPFGQINFGSVVIAFCGILDDSIECEFSLDASHFRTEMAHIKLHACLTYQNGIRFNGKISTHIDYL